MANGAAQDPWADWERRYGGPAASTAEQDPWADYDRRYGGPQPFDTGIPHQGPGELPPRRPFVPGPPAPPPPAPRARPRAPAIPPPMPPGFIGPAGPTTRPGPSLRAAIEVAGIHATPGIAFRAAGTTREEAAQEVIDRLGGEATRHAATLGAAAVAGEVVREYGYMQALGPVAGKVTRGIGAQLARAFPRTAAALEQGAARLASRVYRPNIPIPGTDRMLAAEIVPGAAVRGAVSGAAHATTFGVGRELAEGTPVTEIPRHLPGYAAMGAAFGPLAALTRADILKFSRATGVAPTDPILTNLGTRGAPNVLGLDPNTMTVADVRAKVREVQTQFHPDRFVDPVAKWHGNEVTARYNAAAAEALKIIARRDAIRRRPRPEPPPAAAPEAGKPPEPAPQPPPAPQRAPMAPQAAPAPQRPGEVVEPIPGTGGRGLEVQGQRPTPAMPPEESVFARPGEAELVNQIEAEREARRVDTAADAERSAWELPLHRWVAQDRSQEVSLAHGTLLTTPPDQWTEPMLATRNMAQLRLLAELTGARRTGSKESLRQEILAHVGLRSELASETVESLAGRSTAELKEMLKARRLSTSIGDKRAKATQLISWRDDQRSRSRSTLAEFTWSESVAAAIKRGEPVPPEVLREYYERYPGERPPPPREREPGEEPDQPDVAPNPRFVGMDDEAVIQRWAELYRRVEANSGVIAEDVYTWVRHTGEITSFGTDVVSGTRWTNAAGRAKGAIDRDFRLIDEIETELLRRDIDPTSDEMLRRLQAEPAQPSDVGEEPVEPVTPEQQIGAALQGKPAPPPPPVDPAAHDKAVAEVKKRIAEADKLEVEWDAAIARDDPAMETLSERISQIDDEIADIVDAYEDAYGSEAGQRLQQETNIVLPQSPGEPPVPATKPPTAEEVDPRIVEELRGLRAGMQRNSTARTMGGFKDKKELRALEAEDKVMRRRWGELTEQLIQRLGKDRAQEIVDSIGEPAAPAAREPGAPADEAAVQESLLPGEKPTLMGAEQTSLLPATAGVPTAKLEGTKISGADVTRVQREGGEPAGERPLPLEGGPPPLRFAVTDDAIGAVPANRNVGYEGFVVHMRPSEFLGLNPPSTKNNPKVKELILEGRPVAPPFLAPRWDAQDKVWRVQSHEGRTRTAAIREIYGDDIEIPVHVFPRGEMRARHITPEMLAAPFIHDPRAPKGVDFTRERRTELAGAEVAGRGETPPEFTTEEPPDEGIEPTGGAVAGRPVGPAAGGGGAGPVVERGGEPSGSPPMGRGPDAADVVAGGGAEPLPPELKPETAVVPRLARRRVEPGALDSPDRRRAIQEANDSPVVAPYAHGLAESRNPHPRVVVETRSLAGVDPAPIDATTLAPAVLKAWSAKRGDSGLSDDQMDGIVRVRTAWNHGHGALLADGVGLGKTREAAGLVLDELHRGATKILVSTKSRPNISDMMDEFRIVASGSKAGKFPAELVSVTDHKKARGAGGKLPSFKGPVVLFVDAYNFASYIDAIRAFGPETWIADEAHMFKGLWNARGTAWQMLHKDVMGRKGNIAYMTATPGGAMNELGYLYGLKEWKPGEFAKWLRAATGYESYTPNWDEELPADYREEDAAVVEVVTPPAEVEQVIRELKGRGKWLARDLWRGGVEFGVQSVGLVADTPAAKANRERYDAAATLLRRIVEADYANNHHDQSKPYAGTSRGLAQAYLKQLLFEMKLPHAIEMARAALERGEQVIMSTHSVTGDLPGDEGMETPVNSRIEAAIKKIATRKIKRVMVGRDEEGKPIYEFVDEGPIPGAQELVDGLRAEARRLAPLSEPADAIRRAFGPDDVAVVTGKVSPEERVRVVAQYQSGKRRVALISRAGKEGISLHDTNGRRRYHIIIDYEWQPDAMLQELGRGDRAGQKSIPRMVLLATDAAAERKFAATAASRMQDIGATSKGAAEATGTDALEQFDDFGELENKAMRMVLAKVPVHEQANFTASSIRKFNKASGRFEWQGRRGSAATMRDFLLDLQMMPVDVANEFFARWDAQRTELMHGEEAALKAAKRTARTRGTIRDVTRLADEPALDLYTVENEAGETRGILVGAVTKYMTEIQDVRGRGEHKGRKYVRFTETASGENLSGMDIGPHEAQTIMAVFGKGTALPKSVAHAAEIAARGETVALEGEGRPRLKLADRINVYQLTNMAVTPDLEAKVRDALYPLYEAVNGQNKFALDNWKYVTVLNSQGQILVPYGVAPTDALEAVFGVLKPRLRAPEASKATPGDQSADLLAEMAGQADSRTRPALDPRVRQQILDRVRGYIPNAEKLSDDELVKQALTTGMFDAATAADIFNALRNFASGDPGLAVLGMLGAGLLGDVGGAGGAAAALAGFAIPAGGKRPPPPRDPTRPFTEAGGEPPEGSPEAGQVIVENARAGAGIGLMVFPQRQWLMRWLYSKRADMRQIGQTALRAVTAGQDAVEAERRFLDQFGAALDAIWNPLSEPHQRLLADLLYTKETLSDLPDDTPGPVADAFALQRELFIENKRMMGRVRRVAIKTKASRELLDEALTNWPEGTAAPDFDEIPVNAPNIMASANRAGITKQPTKRDDWRALYGQLRANRVRVQAPRFMDSPDLRTTFAYIRGEGGIAAYFPEVFQGEWHVEAGAHSAYFVDRFEARDYARNLLESGLVTGTIVVSQPRPTWQAELQLSKKGYNRLISELERETAETRLEVMKAVGKAGVIERPAKRFFSHAQPRKSDLMTFERNPQKAMRVYHSRLARYLAIQPFRVAATQAMEQLPAKGGWREWAQGYINAVEGRPDRLTQAINETLSNMTNGFFRPAALERATANAQAIMSFLFLGYSPISALANLTQTFVNTIPALGAGGTGKVFAALAEYARGRPDTKALLDEVGVIYDHPKTYVGEGPTNPLLRRFLESDSVLMPMGMFRLSEQVNRGVAAIAMYRHLRGRGVAHRAAIAQTQAFVRETQFDYSVADLPSVMRNPIMRVALQFKPFVLNETLFGERILRHGTTRQRAQFFFWFWFWAGLKALALFTPLAAMNWLLGKTGWWEDEEGHKQTPFDDMLERLGPNVSPAWQIALFGVWGILGIDASRRMGVAGPQEFVGTTGSPIADYAKLVWQSFNDPDPNVRKWAKEQMQQAFVRRMVRAWNANRDGFVRDKYGKIIDEEITKPDFWREVFGVQSIERGMRQLRRGREIDEIAEYQGARADWLFKAAEPFRNRDIKATIDIIRQAREAGVPIDLGQVREYVKRHDQPEIRGRVQRTPVPLRPHLFTPEERRGTMPPPPGFPRPPRPRRTP